MHVAVVGRGVRRRGALPVTPKMPSLLRQSCTSIFFLPSAVTSPSGYFSNMKSSGVLLRSSTSSECWLYLPIRRCGLRRISPSEGSMSSVISLRSVDLPAPFGPTRAMRLSQSIPKSRLVYR